MNRLGLLKNPKLKAQKGKKIKKTANDQPSTSEKSTNNAKKKSSKKKVPNTPPCRRNPFLMTQEPSPPTSPTSPTSPSPESPESPDPDDQKAEDLAARGSTRAKAYKASNSKNWPMFREVGLGLRASPIPTSKTKKVSPKFYRKSSTTKNFGWTASPMPTTSVIVHESLPAASSCQISTNKRKIAEVSDLTSSPRPKTIDYFKLRQLNIKKEKFSEENPDL